VNGVLCNSLPSCSKMYPLYSFFFPLWINFLLFIFSKIPMYDFEKHVSLQSVGINIAENIILLFMSCLYCNLVMHVIVCIKNFKKFANCKFRSRSD
jgi:hypothetical protein